MDSNTDTKDALSLRLREVAALAAEQERPASDVALELLGGEVDPKSAAAEIIQAAIEKLERLSGSVGPVLNQDETYPIQLVNEHGRPAVMTYTASRAELIVTLHRTIDAQLLILQLVREKAYAFRTFPIGAQEHAGLDLARAILGVSS